MNLVCYSILLLLVIHCAAVCAEHVTQNNNRDARRKLRQQQEILSEISDEVTDPRQSNASGKDRNVDNTAENTSSDSLDSRNSDDVMTQRARKRQLRRLREERKARQQQGHQQPSEAEASSDAPRTRKRKLRIGAAAARPSVTPNRRRKNNNRKMRNNKNALKNANKSKGGSERRAREKVVTKTPKGEVKVISTTTEMPRPEVKVTTMTPRTEVKVTTEDPEQKWLRQQREERVRAKERRRFAVLINIIDNLNLPERWEPLPPGAVDMSNCTANNFQQFDDVIPRDGHTIRSFDPSFVHASCDGPERADESWYDESLQARLFFDVDRSLLSNKRGPVNLTSAKLRLFKKAPTQVEQTQPGADDDVENAVEQLQGSVKVTLSRYLKPPRAGKPERKDLVTATVLDEQYSGAMRLDMRRALEQWTNRPRHNYGLVLTVEDSNGRLLDAKQHFSLEACVQDKYVRMCSENLATLPPTLEILEEKLSRPRNKRETISSNLESLESKIALHLENREVLPRHFDPLENEIVQNESLTPALLTDNVEGHRDKRDALAPVRATSTKPRRIHRRNKCTASETIVSFKELNIDWVVQPQFFTYKTCKGSCTKLPRASSIRKTYGKHLNIFKESEEECCIPTHRTALSIIHMDEHKNIHYSILPNFIVQACGCRS